MYDTPLEPLHNSLWAVMEPTILHPEVAREIAALEKAIHKYLQDRKPQTCWTSHRMHANDVLIPPTCSPFTSFMGYLFPGAKVLKQKMEEPCNIVSMWANSGQGDMASPRGAVTDLLKNEDWQWFVGDRAKPSSLNFPALRTQITVLAPQNTASAEAERLAVQEAVNTIDNFMRRQQPYLRNVHIAWGGPELKAKEVQTALKLDQRWLMLTFIIQVVAVARHAHSFVIGICFVLTMWLNFSAASFLYGALTGAKDISIMYMLSYYTVLPYTMSSAFVFISSFLQSGQMASHGRVNMLTLRQRLAWVYRKAGVAVGVSTIIMLAATGITVMIPIPTARGFAILMLIEVAINAYTFLTVFPSIIIFHHLHFSNKRRNTQRLRELAIKSRDAGALVKRHPHFVSFVHELWQSGGQTRPRRPHRKRKAEPQWTPAVRVEDEDFRRHRRKQPDEFITHVPEPFVFRTDESDAIVIKELHQVSATHAEGPTRAPRQTRATA